MFDECVGAYIVIKLKNVLPDECVSQGSSACNCVWRWESKVQKDVIESGAEPNTEVCKCIIDMYSRCRCSEGATRIFYSMW